MSYSVQFNRPFNSFLQQHQDEHHKHFTRASGFVANSIFQIAYVGGPNMVK